jgi:hypothetical protein
MPYADTTVYVEDKAGDGGLPGGAAPWWLSPDVDIPAHSGEAFQGTNHVQIRVHTNDEPVIDGKITAEVYVGDPSLVMSPTVGTKRIDPMNLKFRPGNVAGSEPVANAAGGTLTFDWIPSADADIDGPGHRCMILRAFPESVTTPTTPFTVPTEQHEAQHNMEILSTSMKMLAPGGGGAGTPHNPRGRGEDGLWWERFSTMAGGRIGRRFVIWALDPRPSREITDGITRPLKAAGVNSFSEKPPNEVKLEVVDTDGRAIDPHQLLKSKFGHAAGLGKGLFAEDRMLCAAELALSPDERAGLLLRFDHSNLEPHTAVMLHGAQWNERGQPEGGITVVAVAAR